jgi:Ser/Thr protein kinase RdoA (MazF antagonist)
VDTAREPVRGIITGVAYDNVIGSALRTGWHVRPSEIAEIPAGWMSRAWAVTAEGGEYLARLVAAGARRSLEAGLVAAEHLRARGVEIGVPVRTLAGALTATAPIGALSLVRRVTGRQLDGADPIDQQWWGDRLGAAHRALDGFSHPGLRHWRWPHSDLAYLAVEPWLRPAIAEAVAAMTRLTVTDRLTYGILHMDPSPAGFVVDPATGRTGLLDWGACGSGPLVYDLAAAVAYAGGPENATELLDGYAAAGPVPRDEIEAALRVTLRFRWAVQADWYASRLAPISPRLSVPGDPVRGDPVRGDPVRGDPVRGERTGVDWRRGGAGAVPADGVGAGGEARWTTVSGEGTDPAADRAGLYQARDALAGWYDGPRAPAEGS